MEHLWSIVYTDIPSALGIVYRFPVNTLGLWAMANDDVFTRSIFLDVTTGKLTNLPPTICHGSCKVGGAWRPTRDTLRWCELCVTWFHAACMKRHARPPVQSVSIPEEYTGIQVLQAVASLPVERFSGRIRMHHTYEMSIIEARQWKQEAEGQGVPWVVDEDWQDTFLERLRGTWMELQERHHYESGFNNWDTGIGVALGIEQMVDALVEGQVYGNLKWFVCPGCSAPI